MAHLNVQYLYDICFCTISQLNFCQIVGGCSGNLAAQTQLAFIKQCLYLRICVLCISARICPSVEAPGSLACDAPGSTNWPPAPAPAAAATRSPTMPKKYNLVPFMKMWTFVWTFMIEETSYKYSPTGSTNWPPATATRSPTMPRARKIQLPCPIHENVNFHSNMTEEAFSKSSTIGSTNLQNINDVQNTRNTIVLWMNL